MTKILNKIALVIVNILVILVTILIFFSIYNFISLKYLHKDYTSIIGFSVFEVVTGSMEPTLNVGDLIIIKNYDNYIRNDIITYKIDDDFITHRITDIDNSYVYTKGDANNSEDNKILHSQIIGKVVFVIDNGGIWREILLTPRVFITIIIMLILVSLCFSYIPKNKRKKFKNLDSEFDDTYYCPIKEEMRNKND